MNWKFWTWWRRSQTAATTTTATRRTSIAALMAEEKRTAAFLKAPDSDLFAAILAELDEFTFAVSDRALDVDLPDAKLRWHVGGSDALLEFKERLLLRERDARLTQAQLEAKARAETPPEE